MPDDHPASPEERLFDRLATMNECVRIYVGMREAGTPVRSGWLEEEVAATDSLLVDLFTAKVER